MENEHQHYERFDMENDYEGGTWVGGEYYYRKKKAKRKQTKEDVLFGIFNESDSDDEEEAGMGGKRRRHDGGMLKKADLTKPVNFVSTGTVLPSEELEEGRKRHGEDDRDREEDGRERREEEEESGMGSLMGASGHAGLGFSERGDSGAEGRERAQGSRREGGRESSRRRGGDDDDDEDDDILPTAFGQRVKEGAERRRKKDAKAPLAKSKAQVGEEFASFEKHTKGIGMRLLEKMGYSGGGLGKNAQGIAKPIETKMRPKNMGMGFNNYRERDSSLPAAPGSSEAAEKQEDGGKGGDKAKTKERLWKKKHAAKKRVYKTAQQLIGETEEKEAAGYAVPESRGQTVLDMRGPQVRLVTNLEHLNDEVKAIEDDVPMPELQHNLRLIVDLAESEIYNHDRKIRQERDNAAVLERERERLLEEAEGRRLQVETLEGILASVDRCYQRVQSGADALDSIAEIFASIQEKFPEEYKMYDIPSAALACAAPEIKHLLQSWSPLQTPEYGVATVLTWRALLACRMEDQPIFSDPSDMQADRDPYSLLVQEAVLPGVRREVTNLWEPRDPEPMLRFIELWEDALPTSVRENILNTLVMPKLTAAVDSWNPRLETVAIDKWLHPWLPILGSRMEPLYQPIRFKLEAALRDWHPSDKSALMLISPWRDVFDPNGWDHLMACSIVPKLYEALRDFVVNPPPHPQESEPFIWVVRWASTVPAQHMTTLLEAYFFRKWQQALYYWLCSNPNFDEVTKWYLDWKGLMPEELLANERVQHQLNIALDMMNQAVEGAVVTQPGVRENVSYLLMTEQRSFESAAASAQAQQAHPSSGQGYVHVQQGAGPSVAAPTSRVPQNPMTGGIGTGSRVGVGMDNGYSNASSSGVGGQGSQTALSLKEMVEMFALENDVQFVPKLGRMHEGLQVYSFGLVSVCVDNSKQLVYAQIGDRWAPVSLGQVLEMHRGRLAAGVGSSAPKSFG
ncbi:hypothetical protein CBR_g50354 [Chara braunii]|uniref:G-patch domain-containing protein n=1 Tax=Chara braunii TaxID=69332 RepID=A0A388K5K3_CHABU|nr:hypothetical protein CBR_g50354 [Chara braunii]|eukprot:GBG65315.1 hypothetical protein CBR_g50354 [Chara braunii]